VTARKYLMVRWFVGITVVKGDELSRKSRLNRQLTAELQHCKGDAEKLCSDVTQVMNLHAAAGSELLGDVATKLTVLLLCQWYCVV